MGDFNISLSETDRWNIKSILSKYLDNTFNKQH